MSYMNNIYGSKAIGEPSCNNYNKNGYNSNCVQNTNNYNECNKNNDADRDCIKNDNCCTGDTCSFNARNAKCICSYMDIIFSEETVSGSPLFFDLNTGTGAGFTIRTEYIPIDNTCCVPCTIDTASQFNIENAKVILKNITLTGPLANNSVLVNGTIVPSTLTPRGLEAMIATTFLNNICEANNQGTKVSVLLNALQSWDIMARIELCGTVTTNSTTCRFKIVFENTTPDGIITLPNPSTFVASEMCLPNVEEGQIINLDVRFGATSQLIAPTLTPVLSDPTNPASPIILTLVGNLIINPRADIQIIQNTKVCFNAMV